MPEPQTVIIPEPGNFALFLLLRAAEPSRESGRILRTLARLPFFSDDLAAAAREASLRSGVGFGPDYWDLLSPRKRPAGLHPFKPLTAADHDAPATGGDILIHLASRRHDLNFEIAARMRADLGGAVEIINEVHGFHYLDGRDLIGFIDGTENPHGPEDRRRVALIGGEDPQFEGGSYIFTQRYVHDLTKWRTLDTHAQELAVGRKKPDSEELPRGIKPPSAHISRVVIEEQGKELQIVRHSFPYGNLSEAGLFFVAYTCDLRIPEQMLTRMVGASGDGEHDRLLDFTRAVSGANFFAPSIDLLRSMAG
ncbi:MAG: Dyp-type peroxidase [Candidatus Binataceae bacterium]|nr:Dyp-type peroxidase [Candidatus Binataceae bacterium]